MSHDEQQEFAVLARNYRGAVGQAEVAAAFAALVKFVEGLLDG